MRRAEREKDRLVTEKSDFVKMISELQADLKRVRKQAEIFGQDLKVLRKEKEHLQSDRREEASKADRARKQTQTQIRLLNEQLTLQKENVAQARADVKTSTYVLTYRSIHNPLRYVSRAEAQLGALNLRHNKECKGLSLQIGYLKAKFIREALLRNNLVWQKNYLLILLDGFERRSVVLPHPFSERETDSHLVRRPSVPQLLRLDSPFRRSSRVDALSRLLFIA